METFNDRTDVWLSKKFAEERLAREQHNPITTPAHYTQGVIEPAEYMESIGIAEDFYAGNVIKYITRYKHKNGIEDVKKAKQYCKMLLDLLETQN